MVLLEKENQQPHSIHSTIESWSSIESDTNKLAYFFSNAQYFGIQSSVNEKKFRKHLYKKMDKSKLAREFTQEDLAALGNNKLLSLFLAGDVLNMEYPFHRELIQLCKYIEFFDISSNETIADIGTGQGIIPILLNLLRYDLKIYATEIKPYLIAYLDTVLKESFPNQQSIVPILSTEKELNLPEPVDKIILTNTFHHFKYKEVMFDAMKKALREDGEIFVIEGIKRTRPKKMDCKKQMLKAEVIQEFNEAGFKLLEEKQIGDMLYLKYIPGQ